MSKRTVTKTSTHICSDEYGVSSFVSKGEGSALARKQPCAECPWRVDSEINRFPPEAYKHSAKTAYDGATSVFGCHMSKPSAPTTCAGFLLRHSHHNMSVRISQITGKLDLSDLSDGGHEIYSDYREMAIANGVDDDDPSLKNVRSNDE